MITEYAHTPVLLAETLDLLAPAPGTIAVDATLGRAGHGQELARRVLVGGGLYVGIDRDPAALTAAEPLLAQVQADADAGEVRLLQGNFADLDVLLESLGLAWIDTALFDLGVSSPQLDDAARGFSYAQDAPLDMRMDPTDATTPTAAELLARSSEAELTRLFRDYGEEKWAARIAQRIAARREREPLQTTAELTEVIRAAIPAAARRQGGHPAKRVFQALRIAVNRELEALEVGLDAAIRWLRPGGRVAVLSFHSLEDRLVKRRFAAGAQSCSCPPGLPVCRCETQAHLRVLTHRAKRPGEAELLRNPRAQSVRLRAAEKLGEVGIREQE